MEYIKNLITFSLALFLGRILLPGAASLECGPPFVPMNGSHSNVKPKYIPGDKIEYACDREYHRVGEKQRTCLTNGSWRGQMPFCDSRLHLGDPVVQGNPNKLFISQNVKDGNNKTCLEMAAGDGLQIDLKDRAVIQVIRLFLSKGKYSLNVAISINRKNRGEVREDGTLAKDSWLTLQCKEKIFADSICIRVTKYSMKICEVEVYGSDVLSCNHPPPQLYVPNGRFIISRERSILKCIGPKGKNYTHSICEDLKWKPIGKPFNCEGHSEDSHKNLVKIIAASVVSVCFVLVCLIAVLIFIYKRRQNPVVVVMHPKEHYCRGGHGPSAPEESEYATVIYSDIPLTPSQMRKLPKNVPPNLPDLLGYSDPKDEHRNNSGNSSHSKEYTQPQDALLSANTQDLSTIKKSSFYGE